MRTTRAFTLVEMLVVIGILSIAGVLVLAIFSSNLRGSNKAQILGSIKQNGQSVLESMTNAIRNADNIVCTSLNPDNTLVIVKIGTYTRYRFIVASSGSENGVIKQDNPVPTIEEINPTVFINRVCNPQDPMPEAIILTDSNVQNGVSVISGSFSRNKSAGFKDNLKITFTLSPATLALPSVAKQIDDVIFETTIQLR